MVDGVFREMMYYNLGATTTANPFTPSKDIYGAKYQWGVQIGETGRYIDQATDQSVPGSITGWELIEKTRGT